MAEETENKSENPSRVKAAMHNAVRYAGIGAVFGYVAHLFFGNPGRTGYFSGAAAGRVATDATFFGVVGAAIGAIWPKHFSRKPEKVEVIVKGECGHSPQPTYTNVANTQHMRQEHDTPPSHAAVEDQRRMSPAQESQRTH